MTERQLEMLPIEERQRLLIEASERYMRGEISIEELETAERHYMPDYESIISELVQARTDIVKQLQKLYQKRAPTRA